MNKNQITTEATIEQIDKSILKDGRKGYYKKRLKMATNLKGDKNYRGIIISIAAEFTDEVKRQEQLNEYKPDQSKEAYWAGKKLTSTRIKQLTKEAKEKAVPGILSHIAEDGTVTKLGEVTKAEEVLPKIDEVT